MTDQKELLIMQKEFELLQKRIINLTTKVDANIAVVNKYRNIGVGLFIAIGAAITLASYIANGKDADISNLLKHEIEITAKLNRAEYNIESIQDSNRSGNKNDMLAAKELHKLQLANATIAQHLIAITKSLDELNGQLDDLRKLKINSDNWDIDWDAIEKPATLMAENQILAFNDTDKRLRKPAIFYPFLNSGDKIKPPSTKPPKKAKAITCYKPC
ncbi:MAG: hypothetical protein QM504_08450 [Pseudomonadota bacterium]